VLSRIENAVGLSERERSARALAGAKAGARASKTEEVTEAEE